MPSIVWFRQDLRLADNPALKEASKSSAILPIFILEDQTKLAEREVLGSASRWWLHHSLSALEKDLGGLAVFKGHPETILKSVVKETNADKIFWNRCYEPGAIARDKKIKSELSGGGLEVKSFNASLLVEPWQVETQSGGPYKVYSPFWRAVQQMSHDGPGKKPKIDLDTASLKTSKTNLDDLSLLPKNPNWAGGWEDLWAPGEKGAQQRLADFVKSGLKGYKKLRDRPDLDHVSKLSPHLHFGEISPRQIWAKMKHLADDKPELAEDAQKFLSELVWREFSYHLLYHFPTLPNDNWKSEFDAYPWRQSKTQLKAWQQGQTGYPMVDAGMRELWQTGFMHNRVRMLVASFLIKHLRLHWHHGQRWFNDTLLDADLANNSASWQWVAGSGADAAPYFRIFNPIIQGQKFDPKGDYVRRWCPELKDMDNKFIHCPFDASDDDLEKAGVRLGETYPKPIVDHGAARAAALAGYDQVKRAKED